MLVWMVVLDLVKLAIYRQLEHGAHRHPPWYVQFLRRRHPTHSLSGDGHRRRPAYATHR